jgi:xanthine dehydrogenase accessory factor
MLEFMSELQKLKIEGRSFVVATIIQHGGSTPRSSGAKMIVMANGSSIGTIGGGKLEADVIAKSVDVIRSGKSRVVDYQFSGADAAAMDMICGGNARVLVDRISNETSDFWELFAMLSAPNRGLAGWLATRIQANGEVSHRFIQDEEINKRSDEPLGDLNQVKSPQLRETAGEMLFVEPVVFPASLFIFGAGHVSQAIARISAMVEFHTVVLDDRQEFANLERFPDAAEIRVDQPVTRMFDLHKFSPADFIVIVTRGHLQDQTVLEKALQTGAGYIGMIGSKRKCRLIFESLLEKGYSEEQIQRVHAPIGLDINAETPEEIAVSIVAELIQQRFILRNT